MPYNLRSRKIKQPIASADSTTLSTPEYSDAVDNSTTPEYSDAVDDSTDQGVNSDDNTDQGVNSDDNTDQGVNSDDTEYEEESAPYDLFMASEYINNAWREEVDNDIVEELEIELSQHIQTMRKLIPTVQTILQSELTPEEKQVCLYKLDVLKNSDPYETDFLHELFQLRKRLDPRYYLLERCKQNVRYDIQIMQLEASDEVKMTLLSMYLQLGNTEDSEYRNRISKLEKFVKLPYNKVVKLSDEPLDVKLMKASKILDGEIYKMDTVKCKILSVLSNYITTRKGVVFALVGDPGVGKTHIATLISKCVGLPFYQITLGGNDDLNTLMGQDSGWVGSNTGEIANAYIEMGSSNGVILIDELDKATPKIWNAINHIIDPVTNTHVKDAFLREVDIDCSRTIFVISLNDKNVLPKYLLSRINVINVDNPSTADKVEITKLYKIPKLSLPEGITFTDDAIMAIVNLSDEKGYREIDGYLNHIAEALNMHYVMKDKLSTFRHCIIKDFAMPFECTRKHITMLTKVFVQKGFTHTMYN